MKIIVRNLSKSFGGKTVFSGLSFTAEEGICNISAPSGAGKTTLLRILMGLETADSGTVSGLENARIAAVFQENRLLEGHSAEENLRFALGGAYDREAARKMLDALGLDIGSPKPVSASSGGMRRRLALARALLAPADVLFLDEPFTGLDAENRDRAMACIERRDVLTLLVSHNPPKSEKMHTLCLFGT